MATKSTKVSKRSQGTPRMEHILLTRVAKFNARGKGFNLTAGYYPTWKVAAKRLIDAGKLELRGHSYFIAGAPVTTKKAKTTTATPAVESPVAPVSTEIAPVA